MGRELAQLGTWKRPQCTGGGTELTPTRVASGTERHVGHLECSREGAPQSLFSISVERGWELSSLRPFRQEQEEAGGRGLLSSRRLEKVADDSGRQHLAEGDKGCLEEGGPGKSCQTMGPGEGKDLGASDG